MLSNIKLVRDYVELSLQKIKFSEITGNADDDRRFYILKDFELEIGYDEDDAGDLALKNIELGRDFLGVPKKQFNEILTESIKGLNEGKKLQII